MKFKDIDKIIKSQSQKRFNEQKYQYLKYKKITDKLEIKQGSFIQQTQYFIPVEIDLSVVDLHRHVWESDFFTCPVRQP
jgi:hypothetical protein